MSLRTIAAAVSLCIATLATAGCGKAAQEASDAVVRRAAIGTWRCSEDTRGQDGAFEIEVEDGRFTARLPRAAGQELADPLGLLLAGTWQVQDGNLQIRVKRDHLPTAGFDVPDADHFSLESKYIDVIEAFEAEGAPSTSKPSKATGRSLGIDLEIRGESTISFLVVREKGPEGVTFDAEKDPPRNPWTCHKR